MSSISADAILSFANQTTVVSEVMHTLAQFLLLWTRTPSNYDVLISRTMDKEWAACHLPVLSQGGKHTLYTGYHVTQPDGKLVYCPGCGGVENRVWDNYPNVVKLRCRRCKSECFIPKVLGDEDDLLGSKGLRKLNFPQAKYNATWSFQGSKPSPRTPVVAGTKTKLLAPSAQRTTIPPSASPSTLPPPPSVQHLLQLSYSNSDSANMPSNNSTETPEAMDVDSPPSTTAPSPLSSLSPSPSPASTKALKIHLPRLKKVHVTPPLPSNPTSQHAQQAQSWLAPPQMKRSRSAPEPKPEPRTIPTSLADITPLEISTDSKKRRKKH